MFRTCAVPSCLPRWSLPLSGFVPSYLFLSIFSRSFALCVFIFGFLWTPPCLISSFCITSYVFNRLFYFLIPFSFSCMHVCVCVCVYLSLSPSLFLEFFFVFSLADLPKSDYRSKSANCDRHLTFTRIFFRLLGPALSPLPSFLALVLMLFISFSLWFNSIVFPLSTCSLTHFILVLWPLPLCPLNSAYLVRISFSI